MRRTGAALLVLVAAVAGFTLRASHDFLPYQYFLEFSP